MVYLIACMGVVFGLIGWHHTWLHRRDLEELTIAATDRISDTIKRSAQYSMLHNQREEISYTINSVGSQPGIARIRVTNEQGLICFSTVQAEVGTIVEKTSAGCVSCHVGKQNLLKLAVPDRLRIFRTGTGERMAGIISPILNEPTCWNAACHAHRPTQRILGVLDVTVSLASLDETTQRGTRQMVTDFTLGIGLVALLTGVLTWLVVHRPVGSLLRGTLRVAAGDLEAKIPDSSRNEIGLLARSFNHMTDDLHAARHELTQWNQNLEARVEEKTAELKKAHQQILHVERMTSIGKLAAIVAHEINNPLSGIHTWARLLLKKLDRGDVDPQGAREGLAMIASESARCGEIVKGLLQFSRPNAKTQMRSCDLNEVVTHSLRLVEHKIALMSLKTRIDLDPALPPVACDPRQIEQALVALLINACEATTHDGELEVGTRPILRPDGRRGVEIRVKDNGSGMDEATRSHIFEPFFTTKEGELSLGVGLAVVASIMTRHGGEVDVDSAPGAGTTFTLRLFDPPRQPETIPASAAGAPSSTGR